MGFTAEAYEQSFVNEVQLRCYIRDEDLDPVQTAKGEKLKAVAGCRNKDLGMSVKTINNVLEVDVSKSNSMSFGLTSPIANTVA